VLDASHDAYARLADPVMCRRRVIFVKPGYWLVVDDLHGEADHQIDVTFQFAPDVKIVSGPEPWILAETRGGHSLWMLPVASTRVETVICCGELDPPCGWVSSDYGQREPAPSVMFSAAATLPWRAMTLLVPVAGGADTPPALATLHDAQGRPTGVRFNAPLRSVHFTDESVTVE
jgi:hypothetical protein